MSPTQRALKLLRERGWKVAITERWISFGGKGGVRSDAFGFGDLLAINPNDGQILLVQVCSYSDHSKRRNKIQSIPESKDWILAGGLILLISFQKLGNRKGYVAKEEYISV